MSKVPLYKLRYRHGDCQGNLFCWHLLDRQHNKNLSTWNLRWYIILQPYPASEHVLRSGYRDSEGDLLCGRLLDLQHNKPLSA